jgi:small-conductance mechanosensitive channel
VPNLRLTTSRVENLEQSSPKESFNAQVCLAYGCDIETVQALLLETVSKNERILASPAPAVLVQALGPHGIDVQVSYWIADPRNAQGQVRSDLNVAMLKALHQAGIELATRPYLAPQCSAGPAQTLPPAGPQRSSADR